MKIEIIKIKGTPDEIRSVLQSIDPDITSNVSIVLPEAKTTLIKSENKIIKAPLRNEPIKEPVKKEKKKIDWSKYKKYQAKPRDKNCPDCNAQFHDDSKGNTRKWCDTCTPLHYSKPAIKPELIESPKADSKNETELPE